MKSNHPMPIRLLLAALALTLFSATASAQSAESVIEDAREKLIEMYSGVDHFAVKTDSFTSYNRVIEKDGEMIMETEIAGIPGMDSQGAATTNTMAQFDALAEHGVYKGTQNVDGVKCHVIFVDDPSQIDPQLSEGEQVTYFIGASDSLMHGMNMSMKDGTSMEMRMKGYKKYGPILYPSTMEISLIQINSAQQQQMKELQEQLKQMPESMRKQMQDQIDQAMGMMSGEPMVVKTEDVVVNGPLPSGIFGN